MQKAHEKKSFSSSKTLSLSNVKFYTIPAYFSPCTLKSHKKSRQKLSSCAFTSCSLKSVHKKVKSDWTSSSWLKNHCTQLLKHLKRQLLIILLPFVFILAGQILLLLPYSLSTLVCVRVTLTCFKNLNRFRLSSTDFGVFLCFECSPFAETETRNGVGVYIQSAGKICLNYFFIVDVCSYVIAFQYILCRYIFLLILCFLLNL